MKTLTFALAMLFASSAMAQSDPTRCGCYPCSCMRKSCCQPLGQKADPAHTALNQNEMAKEWHRVMHR